MLTNSLSLGGLFSKNPLQQKNTEEGFLSYYIITDSGKKIIELEELSNEE